MRMLSARQEDLSPEQHEERQSRNSSIHRITDQIAEAKKLAKDRDSGKRKFDDISADDQQLLHDFETGRLQKRKMEILAPKGSAFRSQLAYHSHTGAATALQQSIFHRMPTQQATPKGSASSAQRGGRQTSMPPRRTLSSP